MRGRSPQGERGLKPSGEVMKRVGSRRSPQGERGLKQLLATYEDEYGLSLPARGAWVETPCRAVLPRAPATSLPARGAWVETGYENTVAWESAVAPRKGSVG